MAFFEKVSGNTLSESIFSPSNRGRLLDGCMFVLNSFLLFYGARLFDSLQQAKLQGSGNAAMGIRLWFIALFYLAPFGAILKRWHFHHRLQEHNRKFNMQEFKDGCGTGCVFNPILNAILMFSFALFVFAAQSEMVDRWLEQKPILAYFYITLFFSGPAFYLWSVNRFFKAPSGDASAFLKSPLSEYLGDGILLINMAAYQVVWAIYTEINWKDHPADASDVAGRLLQLVFGAMFLYFPPRIFYLAEDLNKARTWQTILLANGPVILKALIGTNWHL